MEYALRELSTLGTKQTPVVVLILVLMEYALREVVEFLKGITVEES